MMHGIHAIGQRLKPVLPFLQPVFRVLLGGLFLQSGLEKLWHASAFQQAVLAYQVLPDVPARFYAVLLPWVEVLAGGYLVLGLFTRFSAGLIVLMLVSFSIAIAVVLLRGDAIDCGCFVGGKSEPVTPMKLAEDLLLLAVALSLTLAPPGPWSVDRRLWPAPRQINDPGGADRKK